MKLNFKKLYETQRELDKRINYNESDRFDKKILALLVEIGECANEWRGFKFWSKDKKPRKDLLEEYVDCLHFILSLGIERGFEAENNRLSLRATKEDVTTQYKFVFMNINDFDIFRGYEQYLKMFDSFVGLGEMLGFTWDQVEEAYLKKNKVNHERQENGY